MKGRPHGLGVVRMQSPNDEQSARWNLVVGSDAENHVIDLFDL